MAAFSGDGIPPGVDPQLFSALIFLARIALEPPQG
jgi:hypothetical protein